MPRIHDAYLYLVVYLYRSIEDAQEGKGAGGTGFLVGLKYDPSDEFLTYAYVVTARHNIEERAFFVRVNRHDAGADVLPIVPDQWVRHANEDIAMAPIELSDIHKVAVLPPEDFLTESLIADYGIGPGDDVFLAGRFVTDPCRSNRKPDATGSPGKRGSQRCHLSVSFAALNNHEGRERNQPSLRFGNISMMPDEPIRHGKYGTYHRSFVAETRSHPGYSGSPVFVYLQPFASVPVPSENRMAWRCWLLGIDWGHIPATVEILKAQSHEPFEYLHARINSGMITIAPAWHILELMNDPRLVALRKAAEPMILEERARG